MTVTPLARRRLPDGFVARIRPDLLRNTGELLVGGSPLRALRLSPRAQDCVEDGRVVVHDRASSELAARLVDGNLADPEVDAFGVDPGELTVVVPVRDRSAQLDRCLAALAPLRVVVVDDASLDPAAVAGVVARHGARLFPLDHNLGPAAARNAGLALVATPYVAFVDSDVEVPGAELLALAGHFADSGVALVGPLVTGCSRSPRPRWFERYDATASSLDLGHAGARVQPGSQVAWLPSACLVGRVETLRRVGGFDPGMRVGEDVDLVWRLVAEGEVVRYDPSRVARHDTRATVGGWLGRKFVYGTGGAALAERHGDWTAPAILSTTTAIGAGAVLARRWWSLPVAGLAVAASARSLRGAVPDVDTGTVPLSVDIAVRGLGWAVRQETGLLLRHWWPAAIAAALVSARARRLLVTALVVDTLVAAGQRRAVHPFLALAARRLDDLAYGAGLWVGCLRARSVRCLLPRPSRRL